MKRIFLLFALLLCISFNANAQFSVYRPSGTPRIPTQEQTYSARAYYQNKGVWNNVRVKATVKIPGNTEVIVNPWRVSSYFDGYNWQVCSVILEKVGMYDPEIIRKNFTHKGYHQKFGQIYLDLE